jgi:hypothetical protein
MMLRAVVLVLVLANAVFFAWSSGWFDGIAGLSSRGEREPERLQRQVRPDAVRVLPARAASERPPSEATANP